MPLVSPGKARTAPTGLAELLARSVGRAPDAALRRALETLRPARWRALLALAERHGVVPLLHAGLARRGTEGAVPPDVARRLAQVAAFSALRNRAAGAQLAEVVRALDAASVPALVLKGAHLAFAYYEEPGLRPMSDLDVLVPAADASRAERVLMDAGYASWMGPAVDYERHHHLRPLHRPGSVQVELHRALLPPVAGAPIIEAGIWRRARRARLGAVEALVPSAEDLLEYLCLHLALGHAFNAPLLTLCDLDVALRRLGAALRWERLTAHAAAHGSGPPVYVALRLAASLLGAAVPAQALDALPHGPADDEAADAARVMLLLADVEVPGAWREARPDADGALRRVAHALAPSSARMRVIYGPWAERAAVLPWLYVWRPLDLARRHGRAVLARALGSERVSGAPARSRSEAVVRAWAARLHAAPEASTRTPAAGGRRAPVNDVPAALSGR